MKLAFWKIAKAYNQTDYNEALDELAEKDPAAAASFRSYNPQNFCRAFMNPDIKCDAITNNMAETFNGYIIQARTKHLLFMMEDIRGALMQRVNTKKTEMEKQTSLLCPRIRALLEIEKNKAAYCDVIPSTENIFNVSHNLDSLVVNLGTKSCTCRKWDMMGVPCCHGVACIYFMHMEPEQFVDDWFKRDVYLRSYAHPIPALPGERHWPRVEKKIDPPPIKLGPGRPRKNRIKDPYENPKKPGTLTRHGMEMTCTLCKQKGHNKRGCSDKNTAVPQEPPPKKARGRPRKYAPTTTTDEIDNNANPHHSVTAHPSQLGRGGRMILGGVGARGRGCGRGSGRGAARGRAGSRGRGQTVADGGNASGRGIGRGRGQAVNDDGGLPSSSRGGGKATTRSRGRGRSQVYCNMLLYVLSLSPSLCCHFLL